MCDPPRFENYEEFEHWIARSAFGGRHDETMVMLQRTQTVAIGSAVRCYLSTFLLYNTFVMVFVWSVLEPYICIWLFDMIAWEHLHFAQKALHVSLVKCSRSLSLMM